MVGFAFPSFVLTLIALYKSLAAYRYAKKVRQEMRPVVKESQRRMLAILLDKALSGFIM